MHQAVTKIGMKPCHPGEFVREEVLEPLELSVTTAAEILGVRRATLSDLINEKAALSPEMALRIEKAFGLDMDTCCACKLGMMPRGCGRGQGRYLS